MNRDRNWFDPRFGKRPARFAGRDDVLRDIRASIADPDETESMTILTGIKGAGKTSILAEIRAELDLSRADIVYFIDDANKEEPELAETLADFEQKFHAGEKVKLILAGLPHAIDELIKDKACAFLRKARRVSLGNVRVDEVFALYQDIFTDNAPNGTDIQNEGGAIPESILLRAAEATAGYPYLIQLVGYYLSKENIDIHDKAADKAIFLAKIELYKNIHEPLFWSLSSKDRMFLWAMAQDEIVSEFGEITKRMDVSAGYASKYRERLINAGLIYSSGYGALAFTLPFMKEYIEKEYIERLGGEGGKRRL